MIRSLVYVFEVLSNHIVDIRLLSVDLDVSRLVLSLDLGHHRVAPLDFEYLVGNLVELLHLTPSEQVSEVLYVLHLIKLLSNGKLLFLFMYLIAFPVPYRLHLRELFMSLFDALNLFLHFSLIEVLVCGLPYSRIVLCHVLRCALSIDHVSEGALLKIEVSINSTN